MPTAFSTSELRGEFDEIALRSQADPDAGAAEAWKRTRTAQHEIAFHCAEIRP